MKEDLYYKDLIKYKNKIINNDKIINKNNNYKIEKEYLLKDNTNLSDILKAIRGARLNNTSQLQTQIPSTMQTSISNSTQVQTPNFSQVSVSNTPQTQAQSTVTVQPTSVSDARNLWSPTSFSGVVYKYNRGVIGIERDGTRHEIIFDGTNRHHNEATAEIGRIANCPVQEAWANPFINGMEVSKQGTIIIQLEGDSILVYLPEIISEEQYQVLESEVNPRSNFKTVAFSHGDDIYDDAQVDIEYLKRFYSNIMGPVKRNTR